MPRKAAVKKKPVIKKTTPTARQSAIPTAKHLAASNAIPEYLQRLLDYLEEGGHYLGWEDDDWVIRTAHRRLLASAMTLEGKECGLITGPIVRLGHSATRTKKFCAYCLRTLLQIQGMTP